MVVKEPKMHPRKIARLQFAIEWIATNDGPAETDLETVSKLKSVRLVSDVWNKTPEEIAKEIVSLRLNNVQG